MLSAGFSAQPLGALLGDYQRVARALFCCLLAFAWVYAKDIGFASLNFYQVKNVLQRWQQYGLTEPAQYHEALAAIQRANQLHPHNPQYLDTYAQVLEWGHFAEFESGDNPLQLARSLYLRSLTQRPGWPVTWASLAMLKWRMNELDEEALFYLERADRLGPAMPEVHAMMAEFGISLYQADHPWFRQLSQRFKVRIEQALRHPQSRQRTLEFIHQQQASQTVCLWMRTRPRHVRSLVCQG